MSTNPLLPEGYVQNTLGHLVPKSKVKDIDILRDDFVIKTIASVQTLHSVMSTLKAAILADVFAFMSLSAEQYGAKLGGSKGNLTLMSYDGRYKVLLAVDTSITFNETLHVAKQLIDACIQKWVQGSDDNIKALIEHAFRTDKQGNINVARVLSLLQLNIDDPDWAKAMDAIKDSIQETGSKQYLRFYKRSEDTKKYEQISLDFGGV